MEKKGKFKDLIASIKDEFVDATVNSDVLPEVAESIADVIVSEGTAELFGGAIGAAFPRINGIRLSYMQHRFERNVQHALSVMERRIVVLEANYSLLNESVQEKFKHEYLEWLLDNLWNEKQQEKIPLHVNGYINFMTDKVNDNLMLMFYNTLSELTMLDIDTLRMYSYESEENIFSLCERYGLEPEQTRVIKEKLARLGLLQNRNDLRRDQNIDEIAEYLEKVDRDHRKKSPSGVKFPTGIKKVSHVDTYVITGLGRGFLKSISE